MDNIKRLIKDWVPPIIAAVILAFLINKFVFFNVTVPTESMYPTIKIGDKILVTRVHNTKNLKRGDIVVFHSDEIIGENGKPGEDLIKRLIGLPNDEVEVKDGGEVYINNVKYPEPYVKYPSEKPGKFKVPADSFLFMGDNRERSYDSRYWKQPYIPKEKIMGKAQFVIRPFNRMGKLK